MAPRWALVAFAVAMWLSWYLGATLALLMPFDSALYGPLSALARLLTALARI